MIEGSPATAAGRFFRSGFSGFMLPDLSDPGSGQYRGPVFKHRAFHDPFRGIRSLRCGRGPGTCSHDRESVRLPLRSGMDCRHSRRYPGRIRTAVCNAFGSLPASSHGFRFPARTWIRETETQWFCDTGNGRTLAGFTRRYPAGRRRCDYQGWRSRLLPACPSPGWIYPGYRI